MIRPYIQILRPQQWLKNIFVFAPMFFSNNLMNVACLLQTTLAFGAFCLIASSIYGINDIKDADTDMLHPKKCKRPIASGKLSKTAGAVISGLCVVGAFALAFCADGNKFQRSSAIILTYWLMNVAYCYKLKQYAIVDIFCIATGFVLRVLIGGVASGVWVSQWIVLLTFLIALFLALTKRYDDYCIFERTGTLPRQSVSRYNASFIMVSISIVASVTLVSYIMYTLSDLVIERMNTQYLYLTSIWVLVGLLRYTQNMLVYERSSSPTDLLVKDRFIHLCILGWLISFFIIIYV